MIKDYSPKFWNYRRQIKLWIKFFENLEFEYKLKKILDYGTGPGLAIFVGSNMGFDIVGTDINDRFEELRNYLGTDKYITIFKGSRTVYDDKSFDVIICKAVLSKRINLFVNNAVELQRLIKNDGIIFVSEEHLKYINEIPKKNKRKLSLERETFNKDLYEKLCSKARNLIGNKKIEYEEEIREIREKHD